MTYDVASQLQYTNGVPVPDRLMAAIDVLQGKGTK